ncbi:MAG: DUF1501 domain-containing protein [Gemmataceae bacterium]|nr:DUF1501 domain-containing protein [Gemmataceae bacterium]
MFTIWGRSQSAYCDGMSRRSFLKAGALGAGLTLADVLRARAGSPSGKRPKSVIMVWLNGGPSQLDMYDLKPDAPAEIRGEFRPIQTTVPGFDICEMMPLQARMADRLAVVRSLTFPEPNNHDRSLNFSGFHDPARRPAFGSVVSRFRSAPGDRLPHYVSMVGRNQEQPFLEEPHYAGAAHKPFRLLGEGVSGLRMPTGMTVSRLDDRRQLLSGLDGLRRDLDTRGELTAMDTFTARALDMITSPQAMSAFDLNREPDKVRERYGRTLTYRCDGRNVPWESERLLQARRLVEAGVSVVTLSLGQWDHHGPSSSCGNIFASLREELALLDHSLHVLLTDLRERGLENDVAVVVWGEMGRTPRINQGPGRDHWSESGFVLFSGGGLKTGQVVGATDARGARPRTRAYQPQNVLATLHKVLDIDLNATLTDHTGRPQYLLDDRDPIAELL